MRISSLQLGLIIAGAALVAGVLVYNMWVLRRARQRTRSAASAASTLPARVEPSFAAAHADVAPRAAAERMSLEEPDDSEHVDLDAKPWSIPMDDVVKVAAEPGRHDEYVDAHGVEAQASSPLTRGLRRDASPQPDPDIEVVIALQPARSVSAGALAPGMHARLGKPVRWFGRRDPAGAWQRIAPDATGEWTECAICMLLADRSGAASRNQIEAFSRMACELAPTLPAAFVPPVIDDEVARAEALDRLCAELDMQIGITIQKTDGSPIPGTRLRGMAEASGFRLAPNGRYEWVLEDNGTVLYSLQNLAGEPFSVDMLRASSLAGIVFVLDVPGVSEPARAFDQMKLAAARLARTLGGEMVDDNRRPLTDEALARTRAEVLSAGEALTRVHIEPGSPRALKLFSA